MRATILAVTSAALLGAGAASPAGAQTASNIADGQAGRFLLYSADDIGGPSGGIDGQVLFLLDSHTGDVFARVGNGESWATYAGGLDLKAFPRGEGWQTPRFSLRAIHNVDSTKSVLMLTNMASGATFVRSPQGDWVRYARGHEQAGR